MKNLLIQVKTSQKLMGSNEPIEPVLTRALIILCTYLFKQLYYCFVTHFWKEECKGMGSMSSEEPINFEKWIQETINFSCYDNSNTSLAE